MRRPLIIVGVLLLSVVTVLVGRALTARSRQPEAFSTALVPPPDIAAATERLAAGLRFPTVSHQNPADDEQAAFNGLLAHIYASFPRTFATLEAERIGRSGVLLRWPGAAAEPKPILLMAHMDVVPAQAAEWSVAPFAGIVRDGFIWGRGTMDDKGAVFALLEAVEAAIDRGEKPQRTVYLFLGHDEEVGGEDGAERAAAKLTASGVKLAWVMDEGMPITEGIIPGAPGPVALIGVAEKGYASVRLVARAPGGHSSMPPAITAAGAIAAAVTRLQDDRFSPGLEGPARELFTILAPELPFGQRLALSNLWLFEPLVVRQLIAKPATNATLRTTTAPTMLSGSSKENVLPSEASAVVNFRIHPRDSVEGVLSHVRERVGPDVEATLAGGFGSEPSTVSAIEGDGYRAIGGTIRQVFPDVLVAPGVVVGATDSRHFASLSEAVYRFAPMRVGPDDTKRVHGKDERILQSNYGEWIRFYGQLLVNAAGLSATK